MSKEDREERRAARRARRATRAQRAPGDGVTIDVQALCTSAKALILDYVGSSLPGDSKMDEVLDQLVEMSDTFLVWTWAGPAGPLLELADGPAVGAIVRLLVRPYVQRLFDELRAVGEA